MFRKSMIALLLWSFSLMMAFMITASLLINKLCLNIASREIEDSYTASLTLFANQLHDRLTTVDALGSAALLDDEVIRLTQSDRGVHDLFDMVQYYRSLKVLTGEQLVGCHYLLLLPKRGWVISSVYGVTHLKEYRINEKYWEALPLNNAWRIETPLFLSTDNNDLCLSIVRGYVYRNQSSPIIIEEISHDDLNLFLDGLCNRLSAEAVFLMDSGGKCMIWKQDIPESVIRRLSETGIQGIESISTDAGRIVMTRVGDLGLSLGMLIDDDQVLYAVKRISLGVYSAAAVFVLMGVWFVRLCMRRVIRPVKALTETMYKVQEGNFKVSAPVYVADELGQLTVHFNRMVKHVDNLVEEQYVRQLQLNQSQIHVLLMHINPHFLYNCLFGLYAMIKNEDLDRAGNLAIYLGQYYRLSAYTQELEWPLKKELENVKLFIKIYEFRYSESLSFHIAVEENLEKCAVPVFTIMTLVENAVKHGLRDPGENQMLEVDCRKQDQCIVIRVSDNGRGMPEEKMRDLQAQLDHPVFDPGAHGLMNLRLRLHLMYGKDTSVKIEKHENRGICICVRMPAGKAD